MRDIELEVRFRELLGAGFASLGDTETQIVRSDQPTHQGRDTARAVYFFESGRRNFGTQFRQHVYDPASLTLETTEAQWQEVTLQLFALSPDDPSDLTRPTAGDLLTTANLICAGLDFRQGLRANGVGVLRVTEIRTPYFENDRGQFEPSPSFDLTLTNLRSLQRKAPGATSTVITVERV